MGKGCESGPAPTPRDHEEADPNGFVTLDEASGAEVESAPPNGEGLDARLREARELEAHYTRILGYPAGYGSLRQLQQDLRAELGLDDPEGRSGLQAVQDEALARLKGWGRVVGVLEDAVRLVGGASRASPICMFDGSRLQVNPKAGETWSESLARHEGILKRAQEDWQRADDTSHRLIEALDTVSALVSAYLDDPLAFEPSPSTARTSATSDVANTVPAETPQGGTVATQGGRVPPGSRLYHNEAPDYTLQRKAGAYWKPIARRILNLYSEAKGIGYNRGQAAVYIGDKLAEELENGSPVGRHLTENGIDPKSFSESTLKSLIGAHGRGEFEEDQGAQA